MSKYYRVRSQRQWDWLMKYFEKQGIKWQNGEAPTWLVENYDFVFGEKGAVVSFDGDCLRMGAHGNKLIEVSDLMEDEKMENEDYVTIKDEDLEEVHWGTNYGEFGFIDHDEDGENHVYEQYLPANLEIPKFLVYPKVPMTEAEKKEFDELKRHRGTVYGALDMIEDDFHKLYTRLFGNSSHEGDSKAQLEFARAWADPSLIEVIPDKKWNVRVPKLKNMFYWKNNDETLNYQDSQFNCYHHQQFTAEELKHYGLDNDLFEKVEVQE